MIMTIMCDDIHICTYSMQLEVPGGYLCPRWYIIAFQMSGVAKSTDTEKTTAKKAKELKVYTS